MKVCSQCMLCLDDNSRCCPSDSNPLERLFQGSNMIDGEYRLKRKLGQGGRGAVYLGLHEGLGKLKRPNIVDTTDYGVDPRNRGLVKVV